MPNWIPSLYPGGRARLIPRRTSFNASRRSAGSAARYSVTVDAGMGQVYRNGFDGTTVISEARVLAKPTNCPLVSSKDLTRIERERMHQGAGKIMSQQAHHGRNHFPAR